MKLTSLLEKNLSGVRSYEPGRGKEKIREDYNIKEPVKLASNENPYGCSPRVFDGIDEELKRIWEYPESTAEPLRRDLADFYDLNPEEIIVGNGSDELIGLLVELLGRNQGEIIYADPSFIKYRVYIESKGCRGIAVPLDENYRHDLQAIRAEINQHTRLIFICDPNNPTGTLLTAAEITAFLRDVPEHVLVVLDQAYHEYVTDPEYFSALEDREKWSNLLILRTFSKAYGLAGLRVGYGLSSPEIIHYITQLKDTFNSNRLAQAAACAALKDQQHIEVSRKKNKREKEYLYQKLEELKLDYQKSQGNFLLIKVPAASRKIADELEKQGIIVKPGAALGLENTIRATVGSHSDNQKLIAALEKIVVDWNLAI